MINIRINEVYYYFLPSYYLITSENVSIHLPINTTIYKYKHVRSSIYVPINKTVHASHICINKQMNNTYIHIINISSRLLCIFLSLSLISPLWTCSKFRFRLYFSWIDWVCLFPPTFAGLHCCIHVATTAEYTEYTPSGGFPVVFLALSY